MKSLFEIFKDQIRTKEIWKRVWELNKFKQFKNIHESNKRFSRKITKEDVPAIIVTSIIGILAIAVLSQFFEDSSLTYAILGLMAIFYVMQKLMGFVAKSRKGSV
jgi:nicotinamide riboside transporter PnuC